MSKLSVAPDSICFIGTATVLVSFGSLKILTDPNFLHAGDHAHIGYGLRAKRLTDPACELSDLPPLDFVLLSHYHGDHFDQDVKRQLDKHTPILTTHHAAKRLRQHGFDAVRGLEHWEGVRVTKDGTTATMHAVPGRHGPGLLQYALPPVMGTLMDLQADGKRLRIYISGDTLVDDDLREIPRRFPDIDLALVHLGGTRVFGIMVTMDGDQGVRCMKLIEPQSVIPIHFDDYDRFKSPLADFERAASAGHLRSRIVYLKRGEEVSLREFYPIAGPEPEDGRAQDPDVPVESA